MTNELPLLRLGLAGFSADQHQAIATMLQSGAGETSVWEIAPFDEADAWWVNGSRAQALAPDRIRVAAGLPSEHSLQLDLPQVDRPLAFARPLPECIEALSSFEMGSRSGMAATLQQFESWLSPLISQFSLASHIVEHQSALGSGLFQLRLNSEILAVVDMHGDAAVRATAHPEDFEGAMWQRSSVFRVPENFVRTSLSQLMWQYAVRTQRDVLPKHYRTGLLYFRRAPRVPQRFLSDAHLLIMRELMLEPTTFEQLQMRCGVAGEVLARELAALYFVGSITSNAKRAARNSVRTSESPSNLPSGLDSVLPGDGPKRAPPRVLPRDLTAPAPLRPDH